MPVLAALELVGRGPGRVASVVAGLRETCFGGLRFCEILERTGQNGSSSTNKFCTQFL